MFDQQSLRSACAYAQSDQSFCLSLVYSMSVKLLTEHHLEFLSLKGGCTGSSESTLHCWKSYDAAQILIVSMIICMIRGCHTQGSLCIVQFPIVPSVIDRVRFPDNR